MTTTSDVNNNISLGTTLWWQFIFCISGVGSTILCNWLSYNGGANESALLPVLCSNIGMVVVYFIRDKDDSGTGGNKMKLKHHGKLLVKSQNINNITLHDIHGYLMNEGNIKIFIIAMYDLVASIVSFLALICAGAGNYQVIYSSIIIVTATFRHYTMPNKQLTLQQWISVIIVTVGLFISGLGNSSNSTFHNGIIKTTCVPLISTCIYGFEYVLIEKLLNTDHDSNKDNIPKPTEMCYKTGIYSGTIIIIYILIYVIPNWKSLIIDEIALHNGNYWSIIICYLFLFLCNFLHNWTYFKLLHVSGAVSTGINQALRAVFVFIISGILFCEYSPNQCFSSFKLLSVLIVIGGVFRYAFVTSMIDQKRELSLNKSFV